MQTIINRMLAVGLFTCIVIGAVQAKSSTPPLLLFAGVRTEPVWKELASAYAVQLGVALSSYPRGRAGASALLIFLARRAVTPCHASSA